MNIRVLFWCTCILGDLRSFHGSVPNKDEGNFPNRVRVPNVGSSFDLNEPNAINLTILGEIQ